MTFHLVEQIGDLTFRLPGGYDSEAAALLAAVDLAVGSDEERDLFVDGPELTEPVAVGRRRHTTN